MRLLKLSALISTFLISSLAMAELTYNSVGGVSNIDTTTTPTKPVIYGGFAGTCASGTDTNSTCDTCQGGTGMAVCNKNAVYSTLYLTIVLNTSSTIASASDVTAKIDSTSIYPTVTLGSGTVTLKFLWSDICSKSSNSTTDCSKNVTDDLVITAAGSSSGSTAGTYTVHIVTSVADTTDLNYIDCPDDNASPAAGSGFCHFTAFAGDSKVYADNLGISDSYPTSSAGVDYKSLVFFYEPQLSTDADDAATVARINNKSPYYEINVNNTVSPPTVDERINGLSNGTTYCFIMGNRDLTGNIYFFTPTGSVSGAVTASTLCTTPEKVVGLLDDKHCFIATAAFGSDMAPEVQSFREFRNEYLLPYSWGKTFVKTYYKYSPKYAAMISQSETAKVLVRGALWPLLFFARMSVAIGFWYALAIVAFGALTLWGLYRRLILGRLMFGEDVRGEL